MSEHIRARASAFRQDILAWTALHHFLTAGLLRELCSATVSTHADNIGLEDLFGQAGGEHGVLSSWAVKPRKVQSEELRALQEHVRALVWANDPQVGPFAARTETPGWIRALADARRLGQIDFGFEQDRLKKFAFPEGSSVWRLCEAIELSIADSSSDGSGAVDSIHETLSTLSAPLRVLGLKHMGDLFGDADAWPSAASLYAMASTELDRGLGGQWDSLAGPLADILSQSKALAAWTLEGASAASDHLVGLEQTGDDPRLLGVLNGSHESVVARLEADDRSWDGDRRTATLLPPLLLGSHDVASALTKWQSGRYDDAYRRFWSVLRRQVALGSHVESQATKSQYARALLLEASERPEKHFRPQAFTLGASLLVEAGVSQGLERLEFSEAAVKAYVTPALVDELVAKARLYEGSRLARHKALVHILSKWAENLPREDRRLADHVMNALVELAQGFEVTFHGGRNVGGEALKSLVRLAATRPDLRDGQGERVTGLIVQKLERSGWWTGTAEALKLAVAYVDVLPAGQLRHIIAATLKVLKNEDPDGGMTPIIRPALDLLASEEALDAAKADPALAPGYVGFLLRYGMGQRSAGVSLLFALARLAPLTGLDPADQQSLQKMIDEVRAGARELKSSGVTDAIRAILITASLTGGEAVKEAVESLVVLLGNPRSISFAYAYGPVLDLAQISSKLTLDTTLSAEHVEALMAGVELALEKAWRAIAERPHLLTGFSIPRATRPDPVLVHNWTAATHFFINTRPDPVGLIAALRHAEAQPAFGGVITRTYLAGEDPLALTSNELNQIANEDPDAFYGLLGRRLLICSRMAPQQRRPLIEALVQRCVKAGPREADLAVLLLALPLRHGLVDPIDFSAYERLVVQKGLGLLLHPLLSAWEDTADRT